MPHNDQSDAELSSAIRESLYRSLHLELGWPLAACEIRAEQEQRRRIPRGLLTRLRHRGWSLERAKVLDVGAGLGGLTLELALQGADVYGIEPDDASARIASDRLHQSAIAGTRIFRAAGQSLPFPDETFDYVMTLQVLEHVADPARIIREMHRVLKTGGRCFLSCENYLAFREQEYGVAWLPLLPKPIGARYLRLRGRDPRFLLEHVHYVTYPKVWRVAEAAGFTNETYTPYVELVRDPGRAGNLALRGLARAIGTLSARGQQSLVHGLGHLTNVFRVGVRMHLRK